MFPGIAHLFLKDLERLLCPVRALGLYVIKTTEGAKEDPQQNRFVQFSPDIQLFTAHFRRWVAETIWLTYENLSQTNLPKMSRCPSGSCLDSVLSEYSSLRALRTYRLEIFQRVCLPLPERYGSQYRTTGPSSGGCTDGPPLELCLSTHRSPPPPWVNFGILSMAGGNIR